MNANSIKTPFECISSEDMLHNTKEANKRITKLIGDWKISRLAKLRCKSCPYKDEEIVTCQECKDQHNQQDDQDSEDLKISKMENQYDCDRCGRRWRDLMEIDCNDCGEGLFWEDQEICLLGLDVVALFPSIKSENTGRIKHQQIMKSPIKIEGYECQLNQNPF